MVKEQSCYKCEQCSKNIFGQKAYDIIRSIKRKKCQYGFCSNECYAKYRENKKQLEVFPQTQAITNCLFCGKSLKGLSGSNRKFCAHPCSASYNNKKRLVKCADCLKSKDVRFCSDKCRDEFIKEKIDYAQYWEMCRFNFNFGDYPEEFDFVLLKKHGMYSSENINGVGRDHMISSRYGFDNKIDPEIIKHPANCRLMIQRKNSSKGIGCAITISELLERIKVWNEKYSLTKSVDSV